MKSLLSTAALVLVLAAPLRTIAQDVAWTTVINYVVETETPDGSMALEFKPNDSPPANSSPSPSSTLSPAPVAQPVDTKEDVAVNNNPAPVASSSTTAAATSSSPKAESAAVDTGSSPSCSGPGMNIAWTGDSVSYKVSTSGASGMTTGCLNLGTSFSGQVAVGGEGGTIFEGNYNGNNPQFFDVSFITGYSVPMLCTGSDGASGCSIDLASQGNACPQPNDKMCTNPVGENGNKEPGTYAGDMAAEPWCYACSAPDPYFQPCSGAGYTYPYDDEATRTSTTTITCCIGTSCGATGREGSTKNGNPQPTRDPPCNLCPSGGSKRSLDEVFESFEKQQRSVSPSLLPRKHKRHSHRHAAFHEHAS